MIKRILLIMALMLVVPAITWAAGPHDSLSCTGCHGIHTAKGDIIFAVEPNTKAINPRTKKPDSGVSALCLGCHENEGGMGIMPVSAKHSHPWGVKPNPKVASVPNEILRDGKLECVGCHDPHPSNPNHKYLRVDTKGGANMVNFCALCHSSKAGKRTSTSAIFSSMDETAFKPAPAPAKKPTTKK